MQQSPQIYCFDLMVSIYQLHELHCFGPSNLSPTMSILATLVLNWKFGRTSDARFNMEPENNGFQKDFPFPGSYFQVPC